MTDQLQKGSEAIAMLLQNTVTAARLQNELFDLGADLCVPLSERKALRVPPEAVTRLEQEIDALTAQWMEAVEELEGFLGEE